MGTVHVDVGLVTETCCHEGCHVLFAMTRDYYNVVRNDSSRWWYCPNGHKQHYLDEASDADKLRRAEARETALKDQLAAAVREAETVRVALLRDRQRFANGVCPCCNRTFQNVLQHMRGEHPDYDVTKVKAVRAVRFTCSCGSEFGTLHGLRIHQGRSRRDGWDAPGTSTWRSHLTKVGAR